jgi:hypothetical protein
MKCVILESPYMVPSSVTESEKRALMQYQNIVYARLAMKDCIINYNEAPFASHLLYTQDGVLRDYLEEERDLGIYAGLVWKKLTYSTVVYEDLGISKGMQIGIENAISNQHYIVFRRLPSILKDEMDDMVDKTNTILTQTLHLSSKIKLDKTVWDYIDERNSDLSG